MRVLIILSLVFFLIMQSAFADGPVSGGVNGASAENNVGFVFTDNPENGLSSRGAYIEGSDSINAAESALDVLQESKGEKQLVISTDNLENPNLKKLEPRLNTFQRIQKFLFTDSVSNVKERSKQTYKVVKQDPGGIFFFFLTTGLSTALYMHFVQNPNLINFGIPSILTAISNGLFVKPSLLFPVDNLKKKIRIITKNKEESIGEKLGIDTTTDGFRNFQDASVGVGGVTGGTVVFENLTRELPNGWRLLAFQGLALRDGIFSGLSNSSFILAVRRWQRSENPPLSSEGIDWFIRSQRLAMAYFLPHLYAAKDLTGFIGVAAVGLIGWLAFWKGEELIPALKQKALACSAWLSSLR
jgi:hypothetical protein